MPARCPLHLMKFLSLIGTCNGFSVPWCSQRSQLHPARAPLLRLCLKRRTWQGRTWLFPRLDPVCNCINTETKKANVSLMSSDKSCSDSFTREHRTDPGFGVCSGFGQRQGGAIAQTPLIFRVLQFRLEKTFKVTKCYH